MTMEDDFLSSLLKGRVAAVEAERNRAEIKTVLQDLERQLNEMSPNHKLSVAYTTATKDADGFVPRGMGQLFDAPRKRYTALMVNADDNSPFELCEFNQGPRGYPIEMKYGRTSESIYDRRSLVVALRELLESPHVGSFFNKIFGAPSDARDATSPSTEANTSDPPSGG